MDALDGIWRLVESRAWDEQGNALSAPYGAVPMGQLSFTNGRMLAALCNGDAETGAGQRTYSSYGGSYTFDGSTLETLVDVASDASRIGSRQRREVIPMGEQMLLRPPTRGYGGQVERRELLWERVWRPTESK
jgi:hypothetical protein